MLSAGEVSVEDTAETAPTSFENHEHGALVDGVALVHGEVFKGIRPATTIVEVAQLIDAEARIEIEADAVVS